MQSIFQQLLPPNDKSKSAKETSQLQKNHAALYCPIPNKKVFTENDKLILYSAFIREKIPNPFNHDYNFMCYINTFGKPI